MLLWLAKISRYILNGYPWKRIHKELLKARQLNVFRSRFINMSLHDLGTPLSNIKLSIDICKMLLDNSVDQKKMHRVIDKLDQVLAETDRISAMITTLFEVNNEEACQLPYRPDRLWFNNFINRYLEDYGKKITGNRDLQITFFEGDAMVFIDPVLMTSVIENIVSNAVKYSPDHSTISITTTKQQHSVMLEIKDRGIGISAEDKPFLFQEFFRAKNAAKIAGSGLGLSIAKTYVEMNHGTIAIESIPYEGTIVKITLAQLI